MSDDPPAPRPPGRRLTISGVVLMVASVVIGIVGVLALGSRFDANDLQREVAFLGPRTSTIPGQVAFRVVEPLAVDDKDLTVGVAASTSSSSVTCTISGEDGSSVSTRRGSTNDTFINADISSRYSVAVVADHLAPGSYVAKCQMAGEPSARGAEDFTVGRILTSAEMFGLLGPVFGILGVVVLCGVLLVVGLVLLVVGLVKAGRAKRNPGWPPGPGSQYGGYPLPGAPGAYGQSPPPSYPPPSGPPDRPGQYPPPSGPPGPPAQYPPTRPLPPSGPPGPPGQSPPAQYPPPSGPSGPPQSYPPAGPPQQAPSGHPRPWVAPRDDPQK